MIVISGALVLVALVLLVIGLIGPSLGFVYASIGASLLAFAFLVVGILQRRKEEPVGIDGAPTSAADIAAAIRTPETHPVTSEELVSAPGGEVLIVEGRPRYHAAGCRYLTGKDAKGVDVAQARAEGFTACGVCKPDEALAAAPLAMATTAAVDDDPAEVVTIPAAASTPSKVARTVDRTLDRAPAKKAASAAKAVVKAPAKVTRATTATKATTTAKTASKAVAKAPAKAPAKATKAATAAGRPAASKAVAKAPAKAAAKAAKAPAKAAAAAKAPAKAATAAKTPAKAARGPRS